ncbi:MAG: N-acetyl-D-Glu racemase DgcA [Sphingopyxis sp.]|uniref:N-acetyl-D-Glu racemase DgcA n=1 Tax=Sphingopyxis sp. TaxID=1908224 RepID=UPI002ABA1451|nr:N-acetyl-D-Glu racemase DgcA [Sphingopyxis sp.]MDZ3832225.1 N-acetyl-D-Glu racemase DgcA [Sphingopyxis sp.]
MQIDIARETWRLHKPFRIARCVITESYIVRVTLRDGGVEGQGEAEAHESDLAELESVVAAIEGHRDAIAAGADWATALASVSHPRARNALDCAWWDLNAKRSGIPAWRAAGLAPPTPVVTAYTICLDDIDAMADHARQVRHRKLLKIKLGSPDGDVERMRAVRAAAPDATLIVDANEGWSFDQLAAYAMPLAELGVQLIEQPLPAGRDAVLADFRSPVPLCADESCHDRRDLPRIAGRYRFINIKLDKAGGLTESLALAREARELGLDIMVGCMVGTSLAMAPATLVAGLARYADLDGPLMLGHDRPTALAYDDETSLVSAPTPALWG